MGILGLDVGTTGCKATVFDYQGNIKSSAYREYDVITPKPGWQELNPEKVWGSVKWVIKRSVQEYAGEEIKAISISSFGEAATPVDRDGNILYNSILYIDPRGEQEIGIIHEKLGNDRVLEITGSSIHPMYTLGKIVWIKENLPEIYKKTWKFLLYGDFIMYKLGAQPSIDYSLAARTMAFDITQKQWSDEILDCVGVEQDKFSFPVQGGSIIGQISKNIAYELGLPKGVLLVAGGHDQPCAALGAGITESRKAVDGMGTVECITPAFDKPVLSPEMVKYNFACVPHLKKDMYVTYAFNFTSGSLLKWYRDTFAFEEKRIVQQKRVDVYDLIIKNAKKEPSDIFILPHFSGAATPYMDTDSKGAMVGLSLDTDKSEIIKAVLEATNYEMMVNIECLERAGIYIDELRAVGGGAKSDYWLQLKADMTGKKIVSLNVAEAGTLGVAMLAGTASGAYKSVDQAASRLIRVKKEYYPDPKLTNIYAQKFLDYKKIYPAVKSIYK